MYLPGKCNKTFKMGEAGSFTFEDGKVRGVKSVTQCWLFVVAETARRSSRGHSILSSHATCRPWRSTPRSPPTASRWTRRRSRSTTT